MTSSDATLGWGPGRWRVLALLVLVAASALRLSDLTADLPSYFDLGISLTDEGTYMDAPRKKVLFGEWNIPGEWWRSQLIVPLYSFALKHWFSWWGPGLWEGRLMSAVIGIVTLMLVWGTGRRLAGSVGGGVLLILVGGSYLVTHFNRSAMVETTQLAFVWGIALALTWRRTSFRDFAIGLMACGVVLVKLSGALALPGVALWWLASEGHWRRPLRWLAPVTGVLSGLWMAEMVSPGILGTSWVYCRSNFGQLVDVGRVPLHLTHIPVRGMFLSREAMAVVLALVGLLAAPGREHFKPWRAYLWALLGAVIATSFADLSLRRYLLFLPWLWLLALYGWVTVAPVHPTASNARDPVLVAGQALLVLWAFSGIPMVLGHFGWIWPKYWIALGCLAAFFFLMVRLMDGARLQPNLLQLTGRGRMAALIVAGLIFAGQQGRWWIQRTHHTVTAAREIGEHLDAGPRGRILVGNIGPIMAIESASQAQFVYGNPESVWDDIVPDQFYFVTFTKPSPGYQSSADQKIFETAGRRRGLGRWPMFSEASINREIMLFEVSR